MRRFDVVTIFPEFFSVLDVSLLGKAGAKGALGFGVHDLRDWAEGKHRSVDDTPYGGGAGMVMRPDVWGRALDSVIESTPGPHILAVPTPAGRPLTQRLVEELAAADGTIVIACGRYEGIDRRVADHYASREGVRVVEYSLGDYVLNGGEVAALALIEAVGRLVDGVVGNPESLVEESHGEAGLLEYPAYTRPPTWRGLEVPPILTSGNHQAVDRWRRDQALAFTALRRRDLLAALVPSLSHADKEALARAGFIVRPDGSVGELEIRRARSDEVADVAGLGRALFPAACPPALTEQAIAEFIDTELTDDFFASAIAEGRVQIAVADGEMCGYTLVEAPPAPYVGDTVSIPHTQADQVFYVSKVYVGDTWRGAGVAQALLEAQLRDAQVLWRGVTHALLGTNLANRRALTFYRRAGFAKAGKRTFLVGGVPNDDLVLVRDLTARPPAADLTVIGRMWKNG